MSAARKANEPSVVLSPPTAAWRRALPQAAAVVRKAAAAAFLAGTRGAASRRGGEISVVLTGDAAVRRLNRAYRGKDKPTNVLSFPADELAWPLLGDVVIAFGISSREARSEGKTLRAHLSHLVVHGVLHLLGYDHERDADAVAMERLESAIMARLGFPDPYALPVPGDAPLPQRQARSRGRRRR